MKYVLIIIIFLTTDGKAQELVSESRKKQYLINSQINLTPTQIRTNFRSVDESWLRYDINSEPVPFESAYNLKVFDYFELNNKYDSDLKKQVFKQTADYKTLLDSLTKIRANYLNSVYYQRGFNHVGGETFRSARGEIFQREEDTVQKENDNEGEGHQVNYDIQKKGFFIGIGHVLPYHCSRAFCPKVIDDVEFKQLQITKKYNLDNNSKKSYTQYIFVPMDANTALEIENNRTQVEILRVFNFTGIYSATFNDADFIADNYGKPCKVNIIKGGSMRLLIYNKVTDKIYYEKLFPAFTTK